MANTTAVYARIDTELKESAEEILAKLGITPSSAIQMLYSQIVLRGGMPFDLRLSAAKPAAVSGRSRDELNAELASGMDSINDGTILTAEEFDAEITREFGL